MLKEMLILKGEGEGKEAGQEGEEENMFGPPSVLPGDLAKELEGMVAQINAMGLEDDEASVALMERCREILGEIDSTVGRE